MKISTALFASVVAICCLSCSIKTDDTTNTDDASLRLIDTFNDTKKAAEQGDAGAQFSLGLWYALGTVKGVPKNHVEAAKWYRKAAEQGHAEAQIFLGLMYMKKKNIGVPKDHTEAAKWFRKAAEQGKPYAQYLLGRKYERGSGVPQDSVEAYMWFDLSASNGHRTAKKARSRISLEMSKEQIAEAQAWSRVFSEWIEDFEKRNKE